MTTTMTILSMLQYDNGSDAARSAAMGGGIGGLCGGLVGLAISVLYFVSLWKVFVRAGKPGIAAIVPCWNVMVELEIVGKPSWWLVLFFVPCVNTFVLLYMHYLLAKSFGKSGGFAIGVALLPYLFLPLLAFSDAQYMGPPTD